MHPLFHPLFVDYCAYFNGNQDYFECHEVLEEYWKEIAPGEKLHPLVGYVQLATSMYHWRRGNFVGASRMLEKAIINFELNKGSAFFNYIDFDQLLTAMYIQSKKIQASEPFFSFTLPITNQKLYTSVQEKIIASPPIDEQFIWRTTAAISSSPPSSNSRRPNPTSTSAKTSS